MNFQRQKIKSNALATFRLPKRWNRFLMQGEQDKGKRINNNQFHLANSPYIFDLLTIVAPAGKITAGVNLFSGFLYFYNSRKHNKLI
jgi:hypothetical protein